MTFSAKIFSFAAAAALVLSVSSANLSYACDHEKGKDHAECTQKECKHGKDHKGCKDASCPHNKKDAKEEKKES